MLDPAVLQRLDSWGDKADSEISLLDVLWDLAALEKSAADIQKERDLVAAMRDELRERVENVANMSLVMQRDMIVHVIHHHYRFTHGSDDAKPEHINLATVCERRHGLPIALAALYIDLATSRGWDVKGINFPGHFLVQLGHGNQTILIDPDNGAILEAHDLRRLLKETLGVHAELQHNHYQSVMTRQIIIRYYNNQKTAYIQQDDVHSALGVSENLLRIAPNEPRLYYDAAVMATRLDYYQTAIGYWQKFIALSDDKAEKDEAKYILSRLETSLH